MIFQFSKNLLDTLLWKETARRKKKIMFVATEFPELSVSNEYVMFYILFLFSALIVNSKKLSTSYIHHFGKNFMQQYAVFSSFLTVFFDIFLPNILLKTL